MRVAIKAVHIAPGGGLTHLNKIIEWFGRLVPQTEFVLFGKEGQKRLFVPAPDNFKYIFYEFPAKNIAAQLHWERKIMPKILEEMKTDLLFEPGNRGTLKSPCPKISLIHNIGPFDDDFRDGESFQSRLRLNVLKNATIQSIKASEGVIFISEYSRRIFFQFVNLGNIKTKVIYHGKIEGSEIYHNDEALARFRINKPYLLCVSDIRRYKKILEMVKSYIMALGIKPDLPPLIVAGANHSPEYFAEIQKVIEWSGQMDKIFFTGQVTRNEVFALYRNCLVFLFPSVLETCPNILIDALSSGCAIATSNRGVMPEIAGNAAIYFNPDKIDEFSSKIIEIVKDDSLRTKLSDKAMLRSEYFSWKKTARQTLDFFDEVLGITPSPHKLITDKQEMVISI